MPKLKWDDSYNDKRRQIADMKKRNIITIDERRVKKAKEDANPLKWSDAFVQKYYKDKITNEEVEAYELIVGLEGFEIAEQNNKNPDIAIKRPVEDSAYKKRIDDLYKENLSVEERDEKIRIIQEELEYSQLRYDKKIGKLTGDENIARYNELDNKYGVREYEQISSKIKTVGGYIENVNKKLAKMGHPKKPNIFIRAINRIQRITSGEDMDSVNNYNEYTRLNEHRNELEHTLERAKSIQGLIMVEHPDFEYEKVTKKPEVTALDLAKYIVKSSITKKNPRLNVTLSDAEIANEARVVMESDHFKVLEKEYGENLKYVEPNAFRKRFLAELAPETLKLDELNKENEALAERIKEASSKTSPNVSNEQTHSRTM